MKRGIAYRVLGTLSQIYNSKRNPHVRARMREAIVFRFKTIGRRSRWVSLAEVLAGDRRAGK